MLCPIAATADFAFAPPGWGLNATLPAAPSEEELRFPSDYGDEVAQRYALGNGAEKFVLTRITYPLFPAPRQRAALHVRAIEEFMSARPGEIREDVPFTAGSYSGQRLLIEHARDRSHREVRLVLIGGSLYFASAEWPGGRNPSAAAARFLESLTIAPAVANPAVADEQERWRELTRGSFTLRYDASRWYPDPAAAAGEALLLLRVDQLAEAEFFAGPRVETETMEKLVLATARENADRVTVRKRGKRLQGSKTVEELRFTARVEGANYENHGYFYNGPEGSVQLRAWSPEKTFAQVEGDIAELLDGLNVRAAAVATTR